MERVIEKKLSFAKLDIKVMCLGKDCQIVLWGGEKPHIGCTVMAVPRASLTDDGSISVTSSVLNLTGHKDEEICRFMAEYIAKKYQVVVVCTGGFHTDMITKQQIDEVQKAVQEAASEIYLY